MFFSSTNRLKVKLSIKCAKMYLHNSHMIENIISLADICCKNDFIHFDLNNFAVNVLPKLSQKYCVGVFMTHPVAENVV